MKQQRSSIAQTQAIDDKISAFQQIQAPSPEKCYGKMHVFFLRKKHFVSIGPDWICFVFAFISFASIGFFLTKYVFQTNQHPLFCYFTLAFSLFQSLSYLAVATKDPGVIIPGTQVIQDDQGAIKNPRFCKRCGMYMIRNSYHCRDCDVCIKGYDHHCPWVSKCIGQKNLKWFWAFVGSTPLFLLYAMIAFMYCVASAAVNHNAKNQGKLL